MRLGRLQLHCTAPIYVRTSFWWAAFDKWRSLNGIYLNLYTQNDKRLRLIWYLTRHNSVAYVVFNQPNSNSHINRNYYSSTIIKFNIPGEDWVEMTWFSPTYDTKAVNLMSTQCSVMASCSGGFSTEVCKKVEYRSSDSAWNMNLCEYNFQHCFRSGSGSVCRHFMGNRKEMLGINTKLIFWRCWTNQHWIRGKTTRNDAK